MGNGATPDQFFLAWDSSGITPNSNRVRTLSKMMILLCDKSMLELSWFLELVVVLGTSGAMVSA